ncbi:hypothetical protein D910_06286 [Dendroctonus ponderosae]|uniref:Uncharacterized protein n=1 Tax=Dendroctonus ponderosae TaxID=77166 RepID=U4U9B3_DENPD|nr:hypothetical protein D910_06286 [Dendroctonus ponderosae]KAH1014869.1 hypothetical protein HUJ05_012681 [Dendroctonus ponderosae]
MAMNEKIGASPQSKPSSLISRRAMGSDLESCVFTHISTTDLSRMSLAYALYFVESYVCFVQIVGQRQYGALGIGSHNFRLGRNFFKFPSNAANSATRSGADHLQDNQA